MLQHAAGRGCYSASAAAEISQSDVWDIAGSDFVSMQWLGYSKANCIHCCLLACPFLLRSLAGDYGVRDAAENAMEQQDQSSISKVEAGPQQTGRTGF
jgi:hypothetical protein